LTGIATQPIEREANAVLEEIRVRDEAIHTTSAPVVNPFLAPIEEIIKITVTVNF
jgi:hypothetical protein